jgi:hypothetical protein
MNFECRASFISRSILTFFLVLTTKSHSRVIFHFVAESERRADCLRASTTPACAAPRGTPATKANCSSHTDILASPFAWVGGATRSEASLNKGCSVG